MSRIGLKPIEIPKGIKVNLEGNTVTIEGSKGKLMREVEADLKLELKDSKLLISRASNERELRAVHGLSRTLLSNMIQGVTNGFQKTVEVSGVGYRVQKSDKGISLQVGFSHPVEFVLPQGIEAAIEGTNKIHIRGIDKELVGLTASRIRDIHPADKYKGKGIIYSGEKIKLKPGKAGKTALRK